MLSIVRFLLFAVLLSPALALEASAYDEDAIQPQGQEVSCAARDIQPAAVPTAEPQDASGTKVLAELSSYLARPTTTGVTPRRWLDLKRHDRAPELTNLISIRHRHDGQVMLVRLRRRGVVVFDC